MTLNELYSFTLFLFGVALLFLGFIVLLNKNKNYSKVVFGVLVLCSGWWSISYYFWMTASLYEEASFWVGMLNLGSTFVPIVFYHWIVTLINRDRKILLIFGYLLTLVFASFSFSGFYFTELRSVAGFDFWPTAGFLYKYYVIFIYGGFYALGIFDILKAIKEEANYEKKKLYKVIFLAYFVCLGAGLTNFPLWFDINILPYGNFLLIFGFVFLIIYSISKYNLMDMRSSGMHLVVGLILIASFLEVAFSTSKNDFIFGIFNLLVLVFLSFLLLNHSKREVKQTEHLERVSKSLQKANAKLAKTAKELKTLDKAKNEFLSVAAHQLRTPATAVKGYTSMILEGTFGKCDKGVSDVLQKVYDVNERMTSLIEDLLTTSRIESGHLRYDFMKADIREILENLNNTFTIQAKESNLEFSVDYPKKDPLPEVFIDKNKIREVISNIIDNAIKYTPKGSVKVVAEKVGEAIKISVKDTGRGMTERTKRNLFEKFTRGQESSSEVEGTGLGLFVVKTYIEKHGGTITAYSAGLDKGSEFVIKLPINRAADEL